METIKKNKKIYIILAISILIVASILFIGSSAYADENEEYEYSLFGGNVIKDNNGGWFVKGVLTLGIPDEFYLDYWEASTGDYSEFEAWENNLSEVEERYKETIEICLNRKFKDFNITYNNNIISGNFLQNDDEEVTYISIGTGYSFNSTLYFTIATGTVNVNLYNPTINNLGLQKNTANNYYQTQTTLPYGEKSIRVDTSNIPNGTYYLVFSHIGNSTGSSYAYRFTKAPNEYTVNFNTNGYGTIPSITEEVGTASIMPSPSNTPTNATFSHWENGSYALDAGDTINPTSAGESTWNAIYKYNVPQVTRLGNEFIVSGSSFNYQYSIDGRNPVSFDQESSYPYVEIGESIKFRGTSSTSYIIQSDWTSEYYYQEQNYTVNFNTNGYGTISSLTALPSATVTIPTVSSPPTNTIFIGWYQSNSSNTLVYTAGESTNLLGSGTVYARYRYNAPTVTVSDNVATLSGGSGSYLVTKNGQDTLLESNTYEIQQGESVTFKSFSSTSYIQDSVATQSYGYNQPTYSVTWDARPGYLTGSQQQQTIGSLANTPTNIPTPTYEGYVFKGWYTDVDKTIEYVAGQPLTGNLHVYAKWELAPDYTIYAGIYKWNNKINLPPAMIENNLITNYSINLYFETDGIEYKEIRFTRDTGVTNVKYIKNTLLHFPYEDKPVFNGVYNVISQNTTLARSNNNARLYTIYITEDQELTQEEYNWFNANIEAGIDTNEVTLENLIYWVAEAPIKMVRQMLNFEILGINIAALFFSIATVILLIWVLKKLR